MKILSSLIELPCIRIYAYHGVLPLERKVGGWYNVSLTVSYPFGKAIQTDNVSDTLNYAELLGLVKREMAVPCNLLEHVAGRICKAVLQEHPLSEEVEISITKECPPMGGNTMGAGVRLRVKRDKEKP